MTGVQTCALPILESPGPADRVTPGNTGRYHSLSGFAAVECSRFLGWFEAGACPNLPQRRSSSGLTANRSAKYQRFCFQCPGSIGVFMTDLDNPLPQVPLPRSGGRGPANDHRWAPRRLGGDPREGRPTREDVHQRYTFAGQVAIARTTAWVSIRRLSTARSTTRTALASIVGQRAVGVSAPWKCGRGSANIALRPTESLHRYLAPPSRIVIISQRSGCQHAAYNQRHDERYY